MLGFENFELLGQRRETDQRSDVAVQQRLAKFGMPDVARADIDDRRTPCRRQQLKEFVVSHRSDLVQSVKRMQRAYGQIGLGGLDQHGEFYL